MAHPLTTILLIVYIYNLFIDIFQTLTPYYITSNAQRLVVSNAEIPLFYVRIPT